MRGVLLLLVVANCGGGRRRCYVVRVVRMVVGVVVSVVRVDARHRGGRRRMVMGCGHRGRLVVVRGHGRGLVGRVPRLLVPGRLVVAVQHPQGVVDAAGVSVISCCRCSSGCRMVVAAGCR